MGIPSAAIGILLFFLISQWGEQWERRNAIVESGEVASLQGTITKKWKNRDASIDDVSIDYYVSIQAETNEVVRNVGKGLWKQLSVGQAVEMYPFGEEVFIPLTDIGGHNQARWLFLGVSCIPIAVVCVISLMLRRQSPLDENR